MSRPVRILSIDGGGVRGIIPALVLATLERISGKPIHQLFDLVSGTSTGGILACGLTRPHPPSAAALADVYIQRSADIFSSSAIRSLGSFFSAPKYSASVLEGILYQHLGEAWLSESLTNVLIPSYDIERRRALMFKSWHAKAHPDHDYPIRDVVRATSAAPTYFAPAEVMSRSGVKSACIDGSLVANNPAMCAIASARHLWPHRSEMVILSLGVGEQTDPFRFSDAKNWGKLAWAAPAIDIMMDGITETVDYQIREAMAEHTHYLRVQTRLGDTVGSPSDAIDDGSSINIARLVARGVTLAKAHEDDLCRLAELL
jgi:patatin-like phospholipase/acyl hydrolase